MSEKYILQETACRTERSKGWGMNGSVGDSLININAYLIFDTGKPVLESPFLQEISRMPTRMLTCTN